MSGAGTSSKFKEEGGVPELDLDLNRGEKVGVSVCLDNSPASLQPTLRRSQRLAAKEQCKSLSSSFCSSLSGSCPDTGPPHVPYSYSVPCPALAIPVAANPTKTNLTSGEDWPKSTGRIHRKIPLTSPIPVYPCSTSSGRVLPLGPLPSESLRSYVDQSSYVVNGKPKLVEDGARIRSVCLPPSAPSVHPQVVHLPPAGPQCLQRSQPPSLDQIGSAPRPDEPQFPHHTLSDPVGFRGSRFPSSRHFYMTGTSQDVDIPSAGERLSRCDPSQPSLLTGDHGLPDLQKSGRGLTSGQGGTSPGLLAAVLPSDVTPPREHQSSGNSQRREYRTGVQPPSNRHIPEFIWVSKLNEMGFAPFYLAALSFWVLK